MKRLNEFVKQELYGWKRSEIEWLFIASTIITGLSIYWGDNLMGIISSLTGVLCVICTGKGKLSAYLFGLVNAVLYSIIAYNSQLYGETMLNAIYYIPMQFVGFYIWSKHMDTTTKEVEKHRMTWNQRIITTILIIVATYGYGCFLKSIGDVMPFIDSFTTVASVGAMLISAKMFAEQWWIWVVVDVFSVYMWWLDFASGSDNMATLLMWIVYLLNAVIMLVKWEKEANSSKGVKNNG